MQWANALSTLPSLEAALQSVVQQARSQLHGSVPDLAVLFVSAAFASEYSRVIPLLAEWLPVPVLIGCSGAGIVGAGQEIEDSPAISLTLAHLPGVTLQPFHLEAEDRPDPDAPPDPWMDWVGITADQSPHFILLTDGSQITDLLQGLDYAFPTATKVGGIASGGRFPGSNALFLSQHGKGQLHRVGTVGVALAGDVVVEAVVAQGCRPIGRPLLVSEAQDNIIVSLNDKSPLKQLQDIVEELSPADQKLARQSLFVGILMDEFKSQPDSGDYLIRVILGLDPQVGALAIGDRIRAGQTVRFHLRDARTSAEDLRWVLNRHQQQREGSDPVGALLFACLGRGAQLYDQPDFDSQTFRELIGDIPLGGFFCNGEIGPVGDNTFLHGYTSSFGLFRSAHR